VPSSDLADRAAALLTLTAATEERSLSQLTELAASQVTGCAAANVTVWRHGELTATASSHREPSRLIDVQLASGRGPLIEAIASGGPVRCPDTLTASRWPEFTAAALRMGVRSCVVLTSQGQALVTLSLFGLRANSIDLRASSNDKDQVQLAELLVAYGGALVGAVADYGDSRRLADQFREAASSRAIVDQAKGILMHALGCSADHALQRMQQVSQRTNLRATEVAQRIIDAHASPADRDRRSPRAASGGAPAGKDAALARLAGLAEPPASKRSGRA
jgi:hypothetical protein